MHTHSSTGLNIRILKATRLLGVCLIAAVFAGCQHEKPSIVMKPDVIQVGGAVSDSGKLEDVRTVFTRDDERVVAWASFAQSHGERTARFKWYNPSGHLVLDSEPINVNPDDQLYKWRGVWSVLPLKESSAALMTGKWKVFVFLDEKKVETLYFDVRL